MVILEGYEKEIFIYGKRDAFNIEKSIFITWHLIGFTRMLIRKFIQFHENDKHYNSQLKEFIQFHKDNKHYNSELQKYASEPYGSNILLIFLNFI